MDILKGLLPEGLGQFIMIFVGIVNIPGHAKGFEPLLLSLIAGTILTNIPVAGIAGEPMPGQPGGFLYYFYSVGVECLSLTDLYGRRCDDGFDLISEPKNSAGRSSPIWHIFSLFRCSGYGWPL